MCTNIDPFLTSDRIESNLTIVNPTGESILFILDNNSYQNTFSAKGKLGIKPKTITDLMLSFKANHKCLRTENL